MPHSGRAMVKKLRLQVPGVTEREAALAREADRLRTARTRAHVELFAAKRPAAPQPARPRIELFGARGAAPAGSGGARTAGPQGSPYAANLSRKQEA
jgi:chemotaxis protein CheD